MKKLLLSTMAATCILANDTELQALKVQMEQMSQMMRGMQEKITLLEKDKSATTVASTSSETSKPANSTKPSTLADSASKVSSLINPSLIFDMSYVSRNIKDEHIAHMGLPGITHSLYGSHAHGDSSHASYNAENGFNLNYAELGFSGTVDPMFDAATVFHITDGNIEIEEAYFTTRELPYNLRLKGGKFLSDFGRINGQHQHAWNFSTSPLVYNAFLGDHGINEIGAQLQWVAPTDTYLMFGFEALQGKNEAMFGNGAITDPYDAENSLIGSASQPSLYVGYVKTSADFGDTTILAGASIASGNSHLDHLSDEEPYAFGGKSDLYGIDLTLKHQFDSYSSLTWQSEWLYRDMEGTQYTGDNTLSSISSSDARNKQSGYYTELVYAPNQTWRTGIRYENIYQNDVNGVRKTGDLDQFTAMVEYHSSEFARLRLEYLHSNALFSEAEPPATVGERQNLDSIMFSINIALGKHGAHAF